MATGSDTRYPLKASNITFLMQHPLMESFIKLVVLCASYNASVFRLKSMEALEDVDIAREATEQS